MKTVTTENRSVVSGLFLMFLLFLGLKLTGHIDWSWWLVTSPLWGPIVVVLIVGGAIYATVAIKSK
jgi:hypothetical protein